MRSVLEKQIVRRTNRLIPRAQVDMLALDFLRVLLPHVMGLGIEMPLIGPPTRRCSTL